MEVQPGNALQPEDRDSLTNRPKLQNPFSLVAVSITYLCLSDSLTGLTRCKLNPEYYEVARASEEEDGARTR